jgi:hypothetical protein
VADLCVSGELEHRHRVHDVGTSISDVSLFDSKYTSSGSSEIRFTVVSKVSIERARGLRGRCGQEQQSKSAGMPSLPPDPVRNCQKHWMIAG